MAPENGSRITRKKLNKLIKEETALFDSNAQGRWTRYSISPYHGNIFRLADSGPEQVFIVAQDGNSVVFYDDVEEEFGTGQVDPEGLIEHISLYGDLRFAIFDFPENCGPNPTFQ